MQTKQKIRKGFTLAEILVTLGVIGVIASMTVPTLVQDVQDAQLKTAWKKAYADLNQATKMIMHNNAGTLLGIIDLNAEYATYLNYTKYCTSASSQGCWHKPNETKYLDGGIAGSPENGPDKSFALPGMILSNGTFLYTFLITSNCNHYPPYNYCGWISVDVNGFKGPNTVGKDIYGAYLYKDGLKSLGTQGTYTNQSCSGTGWGCSTKYLYE